MMFVIVCAFFIRNYFILKKQQNMHALKISLHDYIIKSQKIFKISWNLILSDFFTIYSKYILIPLIKLYKNHNFKNLISVFDHIPS